MPEKIAASFFILSKYNAIRKFLSICLEVKIISGVNKLWHFKFKNNREFY